MAGDTVIVRPGTYVENIDFVGKGIHLTSESGPAHTTIDGGSPANPDFGSVVIFRSGEGPDSVLEGFTLTNGSGTLDGSSIRWGGGVFCSGTSPTIRDNIVRDNTVLPKGVGGGICSWINNASPTIVKNQILSNSALFFGGGIAASSSSNSDVTVAENVIDENSATEGGGIYVGNNVRAEILDNVIRMNTAQGNGGGINVSYPDAVIRRNRIIGNSASLSGGLGGGIALVGDFVTAVVTDNLIVLNQAYSCVKPSATAVFLGTGATFDVGAGVILTNPLFVDVPSGDFHLTAPSPCRDFGLLAMPGIGATDFEGDTRSAGGGPDIGGDEFHEHLYCMGTPSPGSTVFLRVVGIPSPAPVLLALGSGVLDPPLVTPWGDFFLAPPLLLTANLGSLPPEGVVTHKITIPGSSVPGTRYPLQAILGTAGNPALRLSNLLEIVIE